MPTKRVKDGNEMVFSARSPRARSQAAIVRRPLGLQVPTRLEPRREWNLECPPHF
jgi:hypothetical protein